MSEDLKFLFYLPGHVLTKQEPVGRGQLSPPNVNDPGNGFGNQRSMGPQSDPVRGRADLP